MSDDQRDPAAEMAAGMRAFVDTFGRAAQAWLEQRRPLIEAIGRLADDPAVRAYIEARDRGEIPPPEPRRACHCFCGRAHPGEYVCDGEGVTTRRFSSRLTGPVDVALCAPCAVAQGLAELGTVGPLG